jgi:alpha-mannosidase
MIYELRDSENEMMMFYWVGNHGGGPTKENIRSILELNDRIDMPVCEMSGTEAFFDSIRKSNRELPVVYGDMQHHASGCYSAQKVIEEQKHYF